MFIASCGWAWGLVDHSIWCGLTPQSLAKLFLPTGAHTIKSKNKDSSCNFHYTSLSYSELYCIKLQSSRFFKGNTCKLCSLSVMFSASLYPITRRQPAVIDLRINQNIWSHIHLQADLASVSSGFPLLPYSSQLVFSFVVHFLAHCSHNLEKLVHVMVTLPMFLCKLLVTWLPNQQLSIDYRKCGIRSGLPQ